MENGREGKKAADRGNTAESGNCDESVNFADEEKSDTMTNGSETTRSSLFEKARVRSKANDTENRFDSAIAPGLVGHGAKVTGTESDEWRFADLASALDDPYTALSATMAEGEMACVRVSQEF
jgi:hypothetical protein